MTFIVLFDKSKLAYNESSYWADGVQSYPRSWHQSSVIIWRERVDVKKFWQEERRERAWEEDLNWLNWQNFWYDCDHFYLHRDGHGLVMSISLLLKTVFRGQQLNEIQTSTQRYYQNYFLLFFFVSMFVCCHVLMVIRIEVTISWLFYWSSYFYHLQ